MRDVSNDPKIIALDIATGKLKWEKKRESKSSFGTPTVWTNERKARTSSCPATADDRL